MERRLEDWSVEWSDGTTALFKLPVDISQEDFELVLDIWWREVRRGRRSQ